MEFHVQSSRPGLKNVIHFLEGVQQRLTKLVRGTR